MRRLPRRQREVLALRYYLDLSEAEIADDPRHQPRRREEPRLARRRRAAHACHGGRRHEPRTTTSRRDAARLLDGRRLRRRAARGSRLHPDPNEGDPMPPPPLDLRRRSVPSSPPPRRSRAVAVLGPVDAPPATARRPGHRAASADGTATASSEPSRHRRTGARAATRAGLLRRRHAAGPRLYREFDTVSAASPRDRPRVRAVDGRGRRTPTTARRGRPGPTSQTVQSTERRPSSSTSAGAARCRPSRRA